MTSAVGVSMDAERASGAAKRRRERRLRSWWRHERMTVTAELAVALHHSRGVGPAVPHEALWGQTPASSMGRRPGVLKEPVPPVVVEHAACPCSGAPLLVVPSLAAAESDGVDGTTLKYLLKLALKEQEKEEERLKQKEEEHEKRMLALNRRVRDDLPLTPAEHAAWKEWACRPLSSAGKRKRKKRRKRKLPRNSSHPRLAARHLGRYGPEGHLCFDTETTSVARAGRTWKIGLSTSHWYLAPSCSVSVTPEEHRKIRSFLGDAYAELFLRPLVSGSHLCGVLYDPLYVTVTCSEFALGVRVFGFFWKMTSGISVCSTPWFDSRYMLAVSLQRLGPELQKTAVSTQLQFIAGHRHLFRSAEAVPLGPDFSADHRDSPVAVRWSMSPLCGGADSQVLLRRRPRRSHSCSSDSFYNPSYLAVTCSVFAFGVHDSRLFWVMTSGNVPVFSAY